MYYINQENEELVKYEVELDNIKLNKLIREIVINCGEIQHKSYNGTDGDGPSDFHYRIKNLRREIIGKTEPHDDMFYSPEDIYHFEYDEYQFTKLVTIITKLMDGDTNMITSLKNYQSEEKEDKVKQIMDELDRLHIEMHSTDNIGIVRIADLAKSLGEQLKKAQEDKMRNLDRKSDLEYYPQVLECINLKEVARIKIEKLEELKYLYKEMQSFFELVEEKEINSSIDRELYKRLIIK